MVKWYAIYMKNYANPAAPLIQSLKEKYKHAPKVQGQKGLCKIAKELNYINWTPEMRAYFEKMKHVICTTCELYTPSPGKSTQFMLMPVHKASVQF